MGPTKAERDLQLIKAYRTAIRKEREALLKMDIPLKSIKRIQAPMKSFLLGIIETAKHDKKL